MCVCVCVCVCVRVPMYLNTCSIFFSHACVQPGGEMYISDVYNSRQVPEEIAKDEVLWSEGISGALQWEEFLRLACDIGFSPPMLVDVAHLVVQDSKLRNIVGTYVCIHVYICALMYMYTC